MIETRGDTDRAVGMQLQSLRIYAGMDHANAAHELGMSSSVLSAFEEGRARPTAATVLAMATLYAVAPSVMFAIAYAASKRA